MSSFSHRNGGPGRTTRILVLAAVLGVASIILSQCRMVQDGVTGVDLSAGRLDSKSQCVKACNETFKAGQQAEEERHKQAERACGPHDPACHQAEAAKHNAIMKQLTDDKEACKKNCYNEGSGTGGQ